jgi:hypothetical protein
MLSLQQILDKEDVQVEVVKVPEWGGEVCIRSLMGWERDQFEQACERDGGRGLENVRGRFCAMILCDAQGKPFYTEETLGHGYKEIGRKNAAALDRLWTRGLKLNRMRKKDVEELVKNSDSAPSGASGSSSATATPPPSDSSSGS